MASLATAGLVAHIVLTIFENLPDDKLPIKMRLPFFPELPQWRFFAPNPGIEDLYVLFRTRTEIEGVWTPWKDLPLYNPTKPWSMLWNPGSRVPKALFDMVSQVRSLASNGAMFQWVLNSEGYRLLSSAVRNECAKDASEYQFMILASVPTEGRDGIKPIMVSPQIPA